MTREDELREVLRRIARQKKLGFNEQGDPVNLKAIEQLERQVRIRLAAVQLHESDYPEATA